MVLRERVDQQERTIQRLERQVERALNLIHDLRTVVTPGELLFAFYITDIDFCSCRTIKTFKDRSWRDH